MTKSLDWNAGTRPRLRDALNRVRPQMAALEKSDLLQINLDPFVAAVTVRGALPQILALQADLLDTFRRFDLTDLELLDTYALAMLRAETVYRALNTRSEDMSALLADAFALRERLVTDAHSLAPRGLIPTPQLRKLNVPNGYRSIGADLLSLSTLLRDHWTAIDGKSPILLAELDKAEVMAEQLLYAIAARRRRTVAASAATDDRVRAFTLLITTYAKVRRAVLYLRWQHGDGDRIAPSLFRKHRRGRAESPTVQCDALDRAPGSKLQSGLQTEDTVEKQQHDATGETAGLTEPFIH